MHIERTNPRSAWKTPPSTLWPTSVSRSWPSSFWRTREAKADRCRTSFCNGSVLNIKQFYVRIQAWPRKRGHVRKIECQILITESTLYPPQRDLIIRTLIIAGCDAIIKFKIRHENEFRNTLVGVASLQIYPRVKGYKGIGMIVQLLHTETRQV